MHKQGVMVKSVNVTHVQLLAQSFRADSPDAAPAAAPAPANSSGGGGGSNKVDVATIGKGIGECLKTLCTIIPATDALLYQGRKLSLVPAWDLIS